MEVEYSHLHIHRLILLIKGLVFLKHYTCTVYYVIVYKN